LRFCIRPANRRRALQRLNPILRGWANYYRYCTGIGKVFTSIDWYVSDRIWRWMRKKRPNARAHDIARSKVSLAKWGTCESGEVFLGRGVALVGGLAIPLHRLREVLRYAIAVMGNG
jgi:hypothetical protein